MSNYPLNGAANYRIIKENLDYIIIEDLGPHDLFKSVTNAAEWVVEQLVPRLKGRKLYYTDSDGSIDQLCYHCGKFTVFKSGGPDGNR